ncbi:cAMP and cAMP-inhibited cGMP 3',5'-cyclic phosphodiesterase 10A-like [Parasteatoda tepidariorum]|uniref:cAMP and cAMP-inhibited cGMP 3',5'-cyclic phosphodiesterase 10A-like n=1 Tax=Parasteatoda tepidariorum TaxID=114398 RepID=UPI00077FC6B4|nr:cAMP and cAMP-inhibited cGMP 3',5'-cyclic phosphodiesterase 10A-like [Parasteatoda tepidariorum]
MGNSESGFREPPKEYLREIRRETNIRLREFVTSKRRHSSIRILKRDEPSTEVRGLTKETVKKFIISHPDFLDDFVNSHVSQNRIRAWLKLSVSTITKPGDEPVDSNSNEEFATEIVERNFRQRKVLILTRNHLSYPFRFRLEELRSLIDRPITQEINSYPEINSYLFPYTEISTDDINRVFINMAIQLFGPHGFPLTELCYFLSTLKVNYFDVEYHNYSHALSHAQSMFWMLKRNPGVFTEVEMKGLMIASIAHDVGHFGVNERYIKEVGNGLERMYHSPILEHHHTQVCFLILADINCNVFSDLNAQDYKLVLRCIRHAIRSTEVSRYKMQMHTLHQLLNPNFDFENQEVKSAVISLMMMACDLCASWKRWPEHKNIVWSLYREFFRQGDKEMLLDVDSPPEIVRMNAESIPQFQLAFMKNIVLPVFKLVEEVFPNCRSILKETIKNYNLWKTYHTSRSIM